MDLANAQETFVHMLGQLNPECKIEFLEWVCREYNPIVEPGNGMTEEPESDLLDSIAAYLKSSVPPNALAPGEPQFFPSNGPNSDLAPTNTLHVDSFLYDSEEEVDSLCGQLQIGRNYCLNCGSWKTSPLNFISHSVSREQLKFIFTDLLPDLSGKMVLDVGSRLGPVLYGGYVYSRASGLVGVEMNSFFCELQCQVVSKYNMADRVRVVCSDICNQATLLQEADVIVLNNVFEFFCSPENQARLEKKTIRIWEFLYTTVRNHGTLIVAIPSIQESWQHLPFKSTLQLDHWVRELTTTVCHEDEEVNRIHLYCVL